MQFWIIVQPWIGKNCIEPLELTGLTHVAQADLGTALSQGWLSTFDLSAFFLSAGIAVLGLEPEPETYETNSLTKLHPSFQLIGWGEDHTWDEPEVFASPVCSTDREGCSLGVCKPFLRGQTVSLVKGFWKLVEFPPTPQPPKCQQVIVCRWWVKKCLCNLNLD